MACSLREASPIVPTITRSGQPCRLPQLTLSATALIIFARSHLHPRGATMTKLNVGIDLSAFTRRRFLKAGAAGLAAGASLPFPAAYAQSRLNVGYMKIGDLSPFFLAMDKAYFKDAGLDINLASMVG